MTQEFGFISQAMKMPFEIREGWAKEEFETFIKDNGFDLKFLTVEAVNKCMEVIQKTNKVVTVIITRYKVEEASHLTMAAPTITAVVPLVYANGAYSIAYSAVWYPYSVFSTEPLFTIMKFFPTPFTSQRLDDTTIADSNSFRFPQINAFTELFGKGNEETLMNSFTYKNKYKIKELIKLNKDTEITSFSDEDYDEVHEGCRLYWESKDKTGWTKVSSDIEINQLISHSKICVRDTITKKPLGYCIIYYNYKTKVATFGTVVRNDSNELTRKRQIGKWLLWLTITAANENDAKYVCSGDYWYEPMTYKRMFINCDKMSAVVTSVKSDESKPYFINLDNNFMLDGKWQINPYNYKLNEDLVGVVCNYDLNDLQIYFLSRGIKVFTFMEGDDSFHDDYMKKIFRVPSLEVFEQLNITKVFCSPKMTENTRKKLESMGIELLDPQIIERLR